MFNIRKIDLKTGIMLLLAGGIIYFLIKIYVVLIPFVLGVILAYLFYPVVKYLRQKNIPRTWAIYILFLVFLILGIIFTIIIIPSFINELENLTKTIPEYINAIDSYMDYLNREYHRVHLPSIIKEVIDRTLNKVEEQVINFIENLTELIINSLSMIISLVITPFITYYLLKDLDKLKKNILCYVPRGKRRLVLKLGKEINKVFVGYLRGQIWVSIFVGILSSIGLLFFNVRFHLLLGIFAGITNMIPYIGPLLGGIPAVFIALLSSPVKAISIIVLFLVIQQLEGSIISPKIISKRVGLHPLTVIFALLAGAELSGVWGLLFAVPVAGSIKVIVKYFIS
ncbi:MAG: AI-2E family transporter [Halanaerobiaceae bacterium]